MVQRYSCRPGLDALARIPAGGLPVGAHVGAGRVVLDEGGRRRSCRAGGARWRPRSRSRRLGHVPDDRRGQVEQPGAGERPGEERGDRLGDAHQDVRVVGPHAGGVPLERERCRRRARRCESVRSRFASSSSPSTGADGSSRGTPWRTRALGMSSRTWRKLQWFWSASSQLSSVGRVMRMSLVHPTVPGSKYVSLQALSRPPDHVLHIWCLAPFMHQLAWATVRIQGAGPSGCNTYGNRRGGAEHAWPRRVAGDCGVGSTGSIVLMRRLG